MLPFLGGVEHVASLCVAYRFCSTESVHAIRCMGDLSDNCFPFHRDKYPPDKALVSQNHAIERHACELAGDAENGEDRLQNMARPNPIRFLPMQLGEAPWPHCCPVRRNQTKWKSWRIIKKTPCHLWANFGLLWYWHILYSLGQIPTDSVCCGW